MKPRHILVVGLVIVALVVAWLVVATQHTIRVSGDRRLQKCRLGVPPCVPLPTPSKIAHLDSSLSRLAALCRAASDHGIRTWVVYGTALGLVRHGGRIPWDDDYDVAVWEDDLPALQELAARDEHTMLIDADGPWRTISSVAKAYDAHTTTDLDIDFFPMRVGEDGMVRLAWSGWQSDAFNKQVRTPRALTESIVWQPFGGEMLPALRDTSALLLEWFGPKALTEALVAPPHTPWGQYFLFHMNPFLVRTFPISSASQEEGAEIDKDGV